MLFLVQGVVLVIHRDQLSRLFYARSSEPRDIWTEGLFISQGRIGDVIGFVRNDSSGITVTRMSQKLKACDW